MAGRDTILSIQQFHLGNDPNIPTAPLPAERLSAALVIHGGQIASLGGQMLALERGPRQFEVATAARVCAAAVIAAIDVFEGGAR